jgi:chemotaxis protein CheY-P-specific phosphatase CheC
MTKLLDKALKAVRRLPSASQDEIAHAMLELANDAEPGEIDPAHLSAVLEALEQVKAGNYASAADVEAAFRRFDK